MLKSFNFLFLFFYFIFFIFYICENNFYLSGRNWVLTNINNNNNNNCNCINKYNDNRNMIEKLIWFNGCGFCPIAGLLGGPRFESPLV